MSDRRGNRNFGGSNKKQGMQSRNRLSGSGKSGSFSSSSGGSLMNQVSPWLSQSTNVSNSFNPLGRSIANDRNAQLALASSLLNNLLSPSTQLNKLQQVNYY